jgi:hypothetical protein
MAYQNLSIILSPAQKADILSKVTALKTAMPFLINLSNEERQRLRKVAENNR